MTGLSEDAKRGFRWGKRTFRTDDTSFVCTVDQNTKQVIPLRSYSSQEKSNIPVTICQAALATSASFDQPVQIENYTFFSGDHSKIGESELIKRVSTGVATIWCPESGNSKPLVKCIVSIGTGISWTRPTKGVLALWPRPETQKYKVSPGGCASKRIYTFVSTSIEIFRWPP